MTAFEKQLLNFIHTLENFEKMPLVFNPWQMIDKKHDLENAVQIRCENLSKYLLTRQNAKYLLIAEAPGYQGCHFSGIAMTSERLILEKKYNCGIFKRSSDKNKLTLKPNVIKEKGFCEPTASVVWKKLIQDLNLLPTDFILWNAFAFHPHKQHEMLTNRTPLRQEVQKAKPVLEMFLALFQQAKTIAIGKTAEKTLQEMDIKTSACVRHPANGGVPEFSKQLEHFIGSV